MNGLFWDISTKRRQVKAMPPIPATGWVAPKTFPRLSDARVRSVDVETYDPGLEDRGPGWARSEGHIVGVAVGVDNDNRWYFPIRHSVKESENLNPDHVLAWLRDEFKISKPTVGANLIYDLGWLEEEGVIVKGDLYDVQYAEALLSERGQVNLDFLSEKYLGIGKETDLLYKWLAEYYGGQPNGKIRAHIHKAPPSLVGPYAEGDADRPIRVMGKQAALLKEQGLWDLFKMENKLIRLLIKMRQHGVAVDIPRAEKLYDQLTKLAIEEQKKVNWLAKQKVNINAPASLAKAFDALGIEYPRTQTINKKTGLPNDNPSFPKDFLNGCPHPIAKRIVELRKLEKLKNDFVKKAILEHNVNGRIHCQFHPMRSDDGGARSGRFSSSDPNLQQVPSRDKKLAPLIRGLFVPEGKRWIKMDASQIEYRFLAHNAVGEGAEELRAAYNENADTDYHKLTHGMIETMLNQNLDRGPTKCVNFSMIYGGKEGTLVKQLGISHKEASEFMDVYNRAAPFAQATLNAAASEAQAEGYVTTILGRRRRFDLWEPSGYRGKNRPPAMTYERALRMYGGNIERAKTYTALNCKLQGSAADFLKMAMLNCWERGYFDEVGYPLLTVHDELDFDDPGGHDKTFLKIKRTFETAIKLKVPVIVDMETGPNWGHVKDI